ncbi:DNA-processing protein DprA [Thalassospiraceae bacterium LMO-SO8]|nr:DNA-processing protein DprA [Alphaproteobacteria bacterium LMO-S08]WND76383.1 DNA-processing protein DprA [Thalassospiraceae bacterium LMO-SO8]
MPDRLAHHRQRTLPDDERVAWLRLIRSTNVGPGTFFRLLERFGTATRALDALPDLARRGGRAGTIRIATAAAASRELEEAQRIGATPIAWGEPAYPPLLAHIHDPPPVIYARGRLDLLGKKTIGVVGARNASVNGRRFAKKLAADLGAGGLMVASGLARGIDAAAHEGALPTGTAAVLGGGIDVVYPAENKNLYDRIAETGVLLSEIAPGTQPQARHFPRRNRIISGMARGVVVVEASPRSGSLITARMALEQGRDVFAVPGAAMDPRARGTNHLIREGATLTESADDVFAVMADVRAPDKSDIIVYNQNIKNDLTDVETTVSARDEIIAALGPTPTTVDELLRVCQFSLAVVSTVLLELELAGRLERHPGSKVSLLMDH